MSIQQHHYDVLRSPVVSEKTARIQELHNQYVFVVVYTRVQTPRRCGQDSSAGDPLL